MLRPCALLADQIIWRRLLAAAEQADLLVKNCVNIEPILLFRESRVQGSFGFFRAVITYFLRSGLEVRDGDDIVNLLG